MRYIKLFEEFTFSHVKSDNEYEFNDDLGNKYIVRFLSSGIDDVYELDFRAENKKGYKHLRLYWDKNDPTETGMLDITNAGIPFTVSNFIFIDIIKDFIMNNDNCKGIYISPVEARLSYNGDKPDYKRHELKKDTRYKLYLRSLDKLNIPNWEVVSRYGKILLFNNKLLSEEDINDVFN